jgi:hypothetical protein
LFAAAVVLLIIGCANVSILLLARGTARRHEFAVRASVGAGRGRLIRQLLTESVLLSVAGVTFGILGAYWAVNAMRHTLPYNLLPHEVAIQLNVPVLLFSVVVAVITGILFGLSPAFELSRPHVGSLLQTSIAKVRGGAQVRRTHRLPIAGQVALALLLVAGAGGAAKAFLAKLHTLKGFDPDHVFSMAIKMPELVATTAQERIQKVLRHCGHERFGRVSASWAVTGRVLSERRGLRDATSHRPRISQWIHVQSCAFFGEQVSAFIPPRNT